MHFFTEPTKLDTQGIFDPFGPLDGDEANKYRISSKHTVIPGGGDAKLFACQDSMMLVFPTIDFVTKNPIAGKVNLVLKPIDALEIRMQPIKYFLYRGVDRNAFLNGASILGDNITANSEFINKLHFHWTNSLPILGLPSTTLPDPKIIGFHDDLATNVSYRGYLLEEFFNSSASTNAFIKDFSAVKVREGEWIGNVLDGEKFEFEIITDTDHMLMNLEYAELNTFQVDATLNPIDYNNVKLTDLAVREVILNYIDPAAFFGMHYHLGVRLFNGYTNNGAGNNPANTTTSLLIKEFDLFTDVLDKFTNKNVVYLDVRSERGYSYGFYQNYKDSSNHILKLRSKADLFYHNLDYTDMPWPMVNLNNPPDNLNVLDQGKPIFLKLSIKDNQEPVLFVEDPKLLGEDNTKQFLGKEELIESGLLGSNNFTETVKLFVPFVTISSNKVNVAWHIKLQYGRDIDDSNSPTSVFKVPKFLDSLFGGINSFTKKTLEIPTKFNHQQNTKRHFVNGGSFSFITDTGLYFEDAATPQVLLYSELAYSRKQSSNPNYPKITPGSTKNDGILRHRDVVYNKSQITVATVVIDVLEIVGYNRTSNETTPQENLHLLGLTKVEWDEIISVIGTFGDHQIYLTFEEQTNSGSPLTDDFLTPYRQFKIIATGLDSSMVKQTEDAFGSLGNIFVYGFSETMLCTKDFAAAQNIAPNLPDPAMMTDYPDAYLFSYTGESPEVKSLFPTGRITPLDDSYQDIWLGGFVNYNPGVNLIGDIFYPVDTVGGSTISSKGSPYPLILISHGNGQRYSDYRTIGKFLAQNGFIVASISNLALNPVVDYEADKAITSGKTFTPGYALTADDYLIFTEPTEILYKYDRSTSKLTVIEGDFTPSTNFEWTDEFPLNWKNGEEFKTYITPKSLTWTKTGSAASTDPNSFGIKWLTNSGSGSNKKADLEKDGSRFVELTAAQYAFDEFSDIKSAIDGATDETTIKIDYPEATVDVYLGTIESGIYYMIHVQTSNVTGSGSSAITTLDVEVKNAQIEIETAFGRHGLGILGRANNIHPHLQVIKSVMGSDVQNNIGLIGHSRGAESVVRAASDLKTSGTITRFNIATPGVRTSGIEWQYVPNNLDNVVAVASLAPTDLIENNSSGTAYPAVSIIHDIPYYVLYGAMEGDVIGLPDPALPTSSANLSLENKNRNSGFAIYDRSENNTEKAMSFVYAATHNGFITDDSDYTTFINDYHSGIATVSSMGLTKQRNIAKGYLNAFMRMHLKNESLWKPYFYGDTIPLSVQDDRVYPQYRNMNPVAGKWYDKLSALPDVKLSGTAVSTTIPYTTFPKPNFYSRPIVLPTTAVTALSSLVHSDLVDFAKFSASGKKGLTSPHDKKGLYIDWTTTSNVLKLNVDSGGATNTKDATLFGYLSFRIGHIVNFDIGSAYEDLSLVNVKLEDLGGNASERTINRPIPKPYLREDWVSKSSMMTVRLPLNSFLGTADLATIKYVIFEFPGAGTVSMDEFEFTD